MNFFSDYNNLIIFTIEIYCSHGLSFYGYLPPPSDRNKSQLNAGKQDLAALFDAIELSWYSKVCSLVTSPGLQING